VENACLPQAGRHFSRQTGAITAARIAIAAGRRRVDAPSAANENSAAG